jgi:hypothetical protein
MEIQDLKSSIDAIQLQLGELAKKLEKKAKGDFWISLISAIILPATIAISGYWFSEALKKRELQQSAEQQSAQLKVSLANQRLETFKFITPLIDLMSTGDPKKQAYVRHLINVLMPDDAPQLLQIAIASKDGNSQNLQKSLDSAQATLVENLFSQNAQVRTSNANEIMVNWYKIDSIIPTIINYATQHLDNGNGVYNSIVVLNNMHGRALKVHQKDVQDFVNIVMGLKNMPKTVAAATDFAQELKAL